MAKKKGMCSDEGNDEEGSGREKIQEGGKMGARIGAKVYIFGDEVGEQNVFAITKKTSLTGTEREVERKERRTRWRRNDSRGRRCKSVRWL